MPNYWLNLENLIPLELEYEVQENAVVVNGKRYYVGWRFDSKTIYAGDVVSIKLLDCYSYLKIPVNCYPSDKELRLFHLFGLSCAHYSKWRIPHGQIDVVLLNA